MEVIADILSISSGGKKKTHILYGANLGSEQLTYYMSQLQGNGMLEQRIENDTTLFYTTEKGRRFLSYFSNMSQLVSPTPETEMHILVK